MVSVRWRKLGWAVFILFFYGHAFAQNHLVSKNNLVWNSPGKNASESMPCGGRDIGLNVWVENGDLLFYVARSGTYDENNALLKLGRVRMTLSPNILKGGVFRQTLNLNDGCVDIETRKAGITTRIKVWVDVFSPNIYVDINSSSAVKINAVYENWRFKDTEKRGLENNENGYKYGAKTPVKSFKDSIQFKNKGVLFFHQNKNSKSIFDVVVKQQGLERVRSEMFNPLKDLIFGGSFSGTHMQPAGVSFGSYANTPFKGWNLRSTGVNKHYRLNLTLHTQQTPDLYTWEQALSRSKLSEKNRQTAHRKTLQWWRQLWQKSFVYINTTRPDTGDIAWQAGRNYQLFRYMLACNAFGDYPTKFNGGLFTYDPAFINTTYPFTPDFRNWGGSVFTAQNQRLVYYPMFKNGDLEMLQPQFNFYLRILKNAQMATKTYWNHDGARFPEQIENFGLSNYAEYGVNHPKYLDAGVDDNPWLEYHWETVLEFCYMMLQTEDYGGNNMKPYVPFIESCVDFFDQHYQYLATRRGSKSLDGEGHLVIYPGSAGETFKMALNSTPTIAGLSTVLHKLLNSKTAGLTSYQKKKFSGILGRIPPITFRMQNGHQTIAPAKTWERINNEESPQLYPVFPFGLYGKGKPGFATALNTWKYDSTVVKFRSYIGWKQDNIVAARLGLTDAAAQLTFSKLKNSGRRFPAFWGPGFDWTPDHNWGGSGMVGLQEMLIQDDGDKIYLLPAWPKNIDVHFKLHVSKKTTVECVFVRGKITDLKITPSVRRKDIVGNEPLP